MSNIEDILSKLQDLGDSIVDALSPSDDYKTILKTSNLNFHELRKEVAVLFRHGLRSGYKTLAAGQIRISTTEDNDIYNVAVELYFLKEDESLQKIGKQYHVYGFNYLPASIQNELAQNGSIKLTFDEDELMDILGSLDKEVLDNRYRPITFWINKAIRTYGTRGCIHYRVKIDDMVLYYRARLYSLDEHGEEHYRTDFLLAHLIGLQQEDANVLLQGEVLELDYDDEG